MWSHSQNPLVIEALRFDAVVVPARDGAIDSDDLHKPLHMLPSRGKDGWSVQFDVLPKLILRLRLSNGVEGLGEFYRDHDCQTIYHIAGDLLGQDLHQLALQNLPIPLCREYDGFECAIWDAYAKSLNIPLHVLLGGKVRDSVRVGSWSSHRKVEEVGPLAARFADQGYGCIKFKCDLEDDVVQWCASIKQAAPDMAVILDPNQRWENAGEARHLLRKLAEIGNILAIEDPLPKWMWQEYGQLRHFSDIRIVQHISLPYVSQGQRVHDTINCLTHGSVDGFNVNGGLSKFRQIDSIVHAHGLYCWHGSEVDLGVLEALYLHQSAAAPSCVWPSDIFGRMIRSHDLLETPIRFAPPFAYIPDNGPGLGIALDEAALEKHRVEHFEFE